MADGSFNAPYLARLSPRERDLVDLVARGLTNKEIAVRLGISLHTTKEYMSRILEKTSLPGRAAVAAAYAAAQQGRLSMPGGGAPSAP
jgi:DNA-binding CsgD family transcriptional regulator